MFQPEQVLDNRYQIIGEIARGGMGVIYRALDLQLKDEVALKVSLLYEEEFIEAFAGEARILTHLRHPGLPQVRGFFADGGLQVLVMEFIGGDNLLKMLEKRGQFGQVSGLPLEEVHQIAEQLGEILDYLHGQGVIHRDIKPENIKQTPKGQLILLDFGLAKDTSKSLHGGSLAYAAPEQISNQGTSVRSDIYSYGATLYHLLSGEMPMSGVFRLTDFHSSKLDSLRQLKDINPLIPEEISNLVTWAMELNPSSRPARIADFRQNWRTVMQKFVNLDLQTRQNHQISDPTVVLDADFVSRIAPLPSPLAEPDSMMLPFAPGLPPQVRPTAESTPANVTLPQKVVVNVPSTNLLSVPTIEHLPANLPPLEPPKKSVNHILIFSAVGGLLLVLLAGGVIGAWQLGFFVPSKPPLVANRDLTNPPVTFANTLNLSLYLQKADKSEQVAADFIFRSGDQMHFGIEPPQDGVLYVLVNDYVEKKLVLFYPNRRFPTSRDLIKAGKEMRYPPIQEISFGKVETKDRDYNADRFYFVFAPNANEDLIKEIGTTISEDKPLSTSAANAEALLDKLNKLADETKTEADSANVSTKFSSREKTIVGLLELRSAGK